MPLASMSYQLYLLESQNAYETVSKSRYPSNQVEKRKVDIAEEPNQSIYDSNHKLIYYSGSELGIWGFLVM